MHASPRDREPSRIPAKKLSRLLGKSRRSRKLVRKYIRKKVPRSSHIFRLLDASSHERHRLLNINQIRYLLLTGWKYKHKGGSRWCISTNKGFKKRKSCKTKIVIDSATGCKM